MPYGASRKRVAVDKFKLSTQTVLTVVAWIVSVLLAYGALNTRVSLVEERVDRLTADVSEIKTDVKTLLRR